MVTMKVTIKQLKSLIREAIDNKGYSETMETLGQQLIDLYNNGDIGDDEISDLDQAVSQLADIARAVKNPEFKEFVSKLNGAVWALQQSRE